MLSGVIPAPQRMVAWGMRGYVHTAFRTRAFGVEHLRLEPGTIIAANHRSDNDVPVFASALYRAVADAVLQGAPWPVFAADDHLFFRGMLAGYPMGIPLALRRLLWPIRVGGPLERHLQCVPVRPPHRMRLVELLRAEPKEAFDGRLPPALSDALLRRAAELGRPQPVRGADVLTGAYADLLWTELDRDEVRDSDAAWRSHLRAAVADKMRLVDALRSGGIVVIFPEGELSADGSVGPLKPGIASLARRSGARLVQPVAISYDPLTPGRTRAYVSVAPATPVRPGRLNHDLMAALLRAMPLTPGQIAAASVIGACASIPAEDWVRRADGQGRPVEPALRGQRGALALRAALAQARRRGAGDPVVRSLARELECTALAP